MTGRSLHFLAGGGEMGALIRAHDWTSTPLGAPGTWPQSLRTTVSMLLASKFPMLIVWGRDYVQLYNDAYRPVLGATKHPQALGQRAEACWPEIWPTVLAPMFTQVLETGEAIWNEDMLFVLDRNGYLEETYFTFSYSAIRDESGQPGGILVTCVETTGRVLGERRLRTLRELASRTADARSVADVVALAERVLAENRLDVPFALFQVDGARPLDALLAAPWPFEQVARTGQPVVLTDVRSIVDRVPRGHWPEAPRAAVALGIRRAGQGAPHGFLAAGASPRLELNADYLTFLQLAAGQIGAAIDSVNAYEEERKRAEAFASIDRAKTAFFSNVSHEFRTPLTLMLGPLSDLLTDTEGGLPQPQRERLELAHRSGLRLQKLVNTLLDFSRIEADRAQASYQPTDLGALTEDVASSFRSAVERVGLTLEVDCRDLHSPVYVDRDMWEKVVLNLVSNAFKFTFVGGITVTLHEMADHVELSVRDTGVGIPAAELPHVFERFRRVEGTRSRTHEGTGIGLALVRELVHLHGGTVQAESEEGRGTTFTVSLPLGSAHLPADRIGAGRTQISTALGTRPFVEEALRWLPEPAVEDVLPAAGSRPVPSEAVAASAPRPRIIWADDNADMRDYVRRLLSPWYAVDSVTDGEAALAAIRRHPPDLVLADIMMPRLDGLGLARALRADPVTRALPVILLSARAGTEARIEGLDAGADDYLVKPFSARELVARVSARLELARLHNRLQREHNEYAALFEQAPVPVAVLRGPHLVFEMANPAYQAVVAGRQLAGRPFLDAMPELAGQPFTDLLRNVMQSGVAMTGSEALLRYDRSGSGQLDESYWTFVCAPLRDPDGSVNRVIAICNDVTEQVSAREAIRLSEERYRALIRVLTSVVWRTDGDGAFSIAQPEWEAYTGQVPPHYAGSGWMDAVHPDDLAEVNRRWRLALAAVAMFESEHRLWHAPSRTYRYVVARAVPLRDAHGAVREWIGTVTDVDERRKAEDALREMDRRKDEFLATLSHELRNPLAPLRNVLQVMRLSGAAEGGRAPWHEMMERQVDHLVRLVDDLLDVSRINRGVFELRRERVELRTIVRNAVEASGPYIHAAGHQLNIRVPDEPAWIDGDPVRLSQIIANLLNNAARYTNAGGEITVTGRSEGDTITIAVRDTGIGIGPETMPHLFTMFRRGDMAQDRDHRGLGVGLALARRLAEMHGGTLSAHSDGPNMGSEFTLRVPCATLATGAAADRPGDHAVLAAPAEDAADLLARVSASDHGET